jgi:nucleotide-binding universal stress UspA family protein
MRFLVGLDGSPQAGWGLDFLRAVPLSSTDEVVVASVVDVSLALVGFADAGASVVWYERLRDDELAAAQSRVDEAAAALTGLGRVEAVVVEGHPVEMLSRLAEEHAPDVVIVGPHGRGRLESLLVGSVSQALLQTLRTSMLVARPIRDGLRTVVVAVDGSTHSLAALRLLDAMPLPAETTIVCTTVIPRRSPGYGRAWPEDVLERIEAEEHDAARTVLDGAVGALRSHGLTVTSEVRAGLPKAAILEAVDDHGADLVVLGARGLGGFDALVLGSVSRAVSKGAPCSVLVVHAPA